MLDIIHVSPLRFIKNLYKILYKGFLWCFAVLNELAVRFFLVVVKFGEDTQRFDVAK